MTKPSKLLRALREPVKAAQILAAIGKGWYYKISLPLRGVRFSAGSKFLVFGSLRVRGPGRVAFGNDVTISMSVTPFTYSPEAVISIGDHCFLNGTRLGAALRIEIGDDCILGECRIMDTNFHSTRVNRWDASAPVKKAPVLISRNVWIAAEVGLLPGTTVGENSVVGFGAVCSGEFPANCIVSGNPARVVRDIPDGSPSAEQLLRD